MTRQRRFLKCELKDAAEAAAEHGLSVFFSDNEITFTQNLERVVTFETVPFPPRKAKGSYVYFMQCDGFIKIGTAVDIARRHKDIQGNNPHPVRLIHYEDGDISDERAHHADFFEYRETGEWFHLEGALFTYLSKVAQFTPNANAIP